MTAIKHRQRARLAEMVVQRPDPCPCGNPLPPIRAQGRAADMLTFPGNQGERISIAPLLFGASIYHILGIEQFQAVQTTPTSLRVRLRLADEVDRDKVWQSVQAQIKQLLAKHKLNHVTVKRAEEPPEPSPGGKYRELIPLMEEVR